MSMKNSNDTIGNRARDLLACGAVPQPTAPPLAPTSQLIDEGICQQSLFIKKQSFITFGSNIPGLFYSASVPPHSKQ
jgi:hypothetical protein